MIASSVHCGVVAKVALFAVARVITAVWTSISSADHIVAKHFTALAPEPKDKLRWNVTEDKEQPKRNVRLRTTELAGVASFFVPINLAIAAYS
jgi:hypothetical protein